MRSARRVRAVGRPGGLARGHGGRRGGVAACVRGGAPTDAGHRNSFLGFVIHQLRRNARFDIHVHRGIWRQDRVAARCLDESVCEFAETRRPVVNQSHERYTGSVSSRRLRIPHQHRDRRKPPEGFGKHDSGFVRSRCVCLSFPSKERVDNVLAELRRALPKTGRSGGAGYHGAFETRNQDLAIVRGPLHGCADGGSGGEPRDIADGLGSREKDLFRMGGVLQKFAEYLADVAEPGDVRRRSSRLVASREGPQWSRWLPATNSKSPNSTKPEAAGSGHFPSCSCTIGSAVQLLQLSVVPQATRWNHESMAFEDATDAQLLSELPQAPTALLDMLAVDGFSQSPCGACQGTPRISWYYREELVVTGRSVVSFLDEFCPVVHMVYEMPPRRARSPHNRLVLESKSLPGKWLRLRM
mmetsp:Transcript_9717/g.23767  ORF Transcript_9717/g.23767 Transcript_9717/m.23767 type:complete len:413 (+) Transcript_9717:2604-3842(+)